MQSTPVRVWNQKGLPPTLALSCVGQHLGHLEPERLGPAGCHINAGQWTAFQGLQAGSELAPAQPPRDLDPVLSSDLPIAFPSSWSHAIAEGCPSLQHVVCLLLNAEPQKQHQEPREEGMDVGATHRG